MKVASLLPSATGMFSDNVVLNSTLGQIPHGVRIVESSKMTIQRTQSTLARQTELNLIPRHWCFGTWKERAGAGACQP